VRAADGLEGADGARSPIPPGQVLAAPGSGPSIAGPGLVTYFSATSRYLPAGNYVVAWSVVTQHTAASSVAGVQVLVADSTVPTSTIDSAFSSSPATRLSTSATGLITHAGGTIDVEVKVRRSDGSGNIIPKSGTVELRRVF